MGPWTTSREVEQPKTLGGKRLKALAHAELVYVGTMQDAEAARRLWGQNAQVTGRLFQTAATIRELIDLMPKGKG